MKFIWLILALSFSAVSVAQDADCKSKRQFSIEYSRCLDQQLDMLKRELVTWENNHILQLEDIASKSGRNDPLQVFKKSRQAFKTFSTEHCRWQYLAVVPDSQAGATLYKECQLELYKSQIELLSKIKY